MHTEIYTCMGALYIIVHLFGYNTSNYMPTLHLCILNHDHYIDVRIKVTGRFVTATFLKTKGCLKC